MAQPTGPNLAVAGMWATLPLPVRRTLQSAAAQDRVPPHQIPSRGSRPTVSPALRAPPDREQHPGHERLPVIGVVADR